MSRYRRSWGSKYKPPEKRSIEELEQLIGDYNRIASAAVERIRHLSALLPQLEELDFQVNTLHAEIKQLEASQPGFLPTMFRTTNASAHSRRLKQCKDDRVELHRQIERLLRSEGVTGYRWYEGGTAGLRSAIAAEETCASEKRSSAIRFAAIIERKKRTAAQEAARKAKLADVENRSRGQAAFVKKELHNYPFCPYCFGPIGENPHADHIYPISLGGLSTKENMVIICSTCNLKKGTKTLREFMESERLDRTRVEYVLGLLGKKF